MKNQKKEKKQEKKEKNQQNGWNELIPISLEHLRKAFEFGIKNSSENHNENTFK